MWALLFVATAQTGHHIKQWSLLGNPALLIPLVSLLGCLMGFLFVCFVPSRYHSFLFLFTVQLYTVMLENLVLLANFLFCNENTWNNPVMKEKRLILTYSFGGGFSLWWIGLIAVGSWWGSVAWWGGSMWQSNPFASWLGNERGRERGPGAHHPRKRHAPGSKTSQSVPPHEVPTTTQ